MTMILLTFIMLVTIIIIFIFIQIMYLFIYTHHNCFYFDSTYVFIYCVFLSIFVCVRGLSARNTRVDVCVRGGTGCARSVCM